MFELFTKMGKKKKGYTLTELIVVVAILGILAALATPMVLSQVTDAKKNTDEANAKTIENVIKRQIAKGDLTINGASKTQIEDAIKVGLDPIPSPKQDNMYFIVNTSTAAVKCDTSTSASVEVQLD